MYTLEQLQRKNLAELKEIGCQLNVFPAADRRCRQNWIDAIVGVNPPLLQLLEVSPAASVEQIQEQIEVQAQELLIESKFGRIVYPRPTQKPIEPAVETSSGVEVDLVQESIAQVAENAPVASVDRVLEASLKPSYPRNARRDCPCCVGIQSLYQTRNFCMQTWVIRCLYCTYERIKDSRCAYLAVPEPVHGPDEYPYKTEAILQASAFQAVPPSYSPPCDYSCTWAPIAQAAENSPGVKVDPVLEPIAQAVETSPGVEVEQVSEPIAQAVETSPGVEVDRAQEPIAQGAEISPGVESDQKPILTGVTFSPGFLARYFPPQSENIRFRFDADGQLSLLDFEVQSQPEPPDPDDFESIEEFREALARWDFEHLEELAVSLASMSEWVPCPTDWYEFDTPREPSEVLELSRELELSQVLELSTSNFSIPTFSAEDVSPNRTDEPPDTAVYARLPKPKPPSFPPTAAGHAYQTYTKRRSNASQTESKRIPNSLNLLCQFDRSSFLKLVYCGAIAVGRAPPGGDAM